MKDTVYELLGENTTKEMQDCRKGPQVSYRNVVNVQDLGHVS